MHIDLKKGQPSLDLLPVELYRTVSRQVFGEPNAAEDILQVQHFKEFFQKSEQTHVQLKYGADRGHPEFLKDLADFLTRQYNKMVFSENLCITPGASLSIQHILSILTRPQTQTRFAYFQDPTYFLVFKIFADLGFKKEQFVSVPDTLTGLDLDKLETHLKDNPIDPELPRDPEIYDAVLYCVPTHANPTGSILSREKRIRLVELARKYRLLVICDDVYDILTYEGNVPLRTVAFDLDTKEDPVIISNCTFSKILSPGARVGWIEAHEKIIQKLGDCGSFSSGGCPAHLSSQIVHGMLKDNLLDKHIEKLKKELKNRLLKGLWEPIVEHIGSLGCIIPIVPTGGYFIWVKIPFDTEKLLSIIEKNNIQLNVGVGEDSQVEPDNSKKSFIYNQGAGERFIRLSFAHYDVPTLQEGIKRLSKAILLGLRKY